MKVVERSENQRYWVVRATSGMFINHFINGEMIAIGHLDPLNLPSTGKGKFSPKMGDIKKRMEMLANGHSGTHKRSVTSHYNQVKSFVEDMNPGDLVVSIDSRYLIVGKITGHPSISKEAVRVIYNAERNLYKDMIYNLRRSVRWGPVLARRILPTAMNRSIAARQTVFNIDKYWRELYHLLYPAFIFEDRLYLSARINQENKISAFSVGQFYRLLTEIEVIVKNFDKVKPDCNFEEIFSEQLKVHGITIDTIAEFMSPGSIWTSFGLEGKSVKKVAVGVLLFMLIFGGRAGPLSTDGIITSKMREDILNFMLKRFEAEDVESIRQQLLPEVPNLDTNQLDDDAEGYNFDFLP